MRKDYEIVGDWVTGIKENLTRDGAVFSGGLVNSIRFEIKKSPTQNNYKIFGLKRIDNIIKGVPPGGNYGTSYKDLFPWVSAKLLPSPFRVTSLAWFVWRKINKEGSKRFREGGRPFIVQSVVNKDTIDELIDSVGREKVTKITSEILK